MPNISELVRDEWFKFESVVRRKGKLTSQECGETVQVDDDLLIAYGALTLVGIVSGTMPLLLVGCVGLGIVKAEREKNEMQALRMPIEIDEERIALKDQAESGVYPKKKRG